MSTVTTSTRRFSRTSRLPARYWARAASSCSTHRQPRASRRSRRRVVGFGATGLVPLACTPTELFATLDEDDASAYATVVAEAAREAGREFRENVVAGARIVGTWSKQPTLRHRVIRKARRALVSPGVENRPRLS